MWKHPNSHNQIIKISRTTNMELETMSCLNWWAYSLMGFTQRPHGRSSLCCIWPFALKPLCEGRLTRFNKRLESFTNWSTLANTWVQYFHCLFSVYFVVESQILQWVTSQFIWLNILLFASRGFFSLHCMWGYFPAMSFLNCSILWFIFHHGDKEDVSFHEKSPDIVFPSS